MPYKAIIVGEAVGPTAEVAAVLSRLGFEPPEVSQRLDHTLARLRREAFDLLIVSLDGVDAVQLGSLERAIRAEPAIGVVGTAASADPDLMLRAMRAGVREFLVYPPSPHDLRQAVDRLVRRAASAASDGTLVAVYSGKGGLGVTTIAVNLAEAFALTDARRRVALADGVFAGGDVRVFLNLHPPYDMGSLVTKLDEIDADLLVSLTSKRPSGLFVLSSVEDAALDDAFDGATASNIMQQLRATFDMTVVDCEHHLSERTLAVLDLADRIIVLTQPSVPALKSTRRTLDLFQRLGYTSDKTCVVLNRFLHGDIFTQDNVADSLGRPVFWALPNDYRVASAALNKGITVAQHDPSSKLARSITELALKMNGVRAAAVATNGSQRPPSRLRTLFGKSPGADHVA